MKQFVLFLMSLTVISCGCSHKKPFQSAKSPEIQGPPKAIEGTPWAEILDEMSTVPMIETMAIGYPCSSHRDCTEPQEACHGDPGRCFPCPVGSACDYDYQEVCDQGCGGDFSCQVAAYSQSLGYYYGLTSWIQYQTGPRCSYRGYTAFASFPLLGRTTAVECPDMNCTPGVVTILAIEDCESICLSLGGLDIGGIQSDYDGDGDVDLADYAEIQLRVGDSL